MAAALYSVPSARCLAGSLWMCEVYAGGREFDNAVGVCNNSMQPVQVMTLFAKSTEGLPPSRRGLLWTVEPTLV
jgi:hypothetical protein